MIISLNEIEVLCKKAFEGAGYADGDYEDAALMIAWSQRHGLAGFTELEKALPFLGDEQKHSFEVLYQDEIFTIVDAKGQSILSNGAIIADVIAAKSTRRGTAALRLLNCHNRKLILGYLSKCAMRGHHISVTWQDSATLGYIANFKANSPLPVIRQYHTDDVHMNFPKACSLNILFSQQIEFEFSTNELDYATLELETQPSSMQLNEENAYKHGVEVNEMLWQKLKDIASNNLVSASERSRQGAG